MSSYDENEDKIVPKKSNLEKRRYIRPEEVADYRTQHKSVLDQLIASEDAAGIEEYSHSVERQENGSAFQGQAKSKKLPIKKPVYEREEGAHLI